MPNSASKIASTLKVLQEYHQSEMHSHRPKGEKYLLYVDENGSLQGETYNKAFSLVRTIRYLFSFKSYRATDVAEVLNNTFIQIEDEWDEGTKTTFYNEVEKISGSLTQLNADLSKSARESNILREALQSVKNAHKSHLLHSLTAARGYDEKAAILEKIDTTNYLKDKQFRWKVMRHLAGCQPTLFLAHKNKFSLQTKEEVLQVGVFIPKDYEVRFLEEFKHLVTQNDLDLAKATFTERQTFYSKIVAESGICFGYTMLQIAQMGDQEFTAMIQNAREIQDIYRENNAKKAKETEEKLGRAILESPDMFPLILFLAAKHLKKTPEDLQRIFAKGKSSTAIAKQVGEIAANFLGKQSNDIEQDSSLHPQSSQEASALSKEEMQNLHKALSQLSPPSAFPEKIFQDLHLEEGPTHFHKMSIRKLSQSLTQLSKGGTQGKFHLSIRSETAGHAIFVSLGTFSYSDINDIDPLTFEPRVRTFSTIEEMTESLSTHIALQYPSYKTASLYEYRQVPTGTWSSLWHQFQVWLNKDLF